MKIVREYFSFIFFFYILGGIVVGYLSTKKGHFEPWLVFPAACGFVIFSIIQNQIVLGRLFIAAFTLSIFEIRMTNEIQHQIASHERATVL